MVPVIIIDASVNAKANHSDKEGRVIATIDKAYIQVAFIVETNTGKWLFTFRTLFTK